MSCRSARLVSRMRAILASWITGQPCLSEPLNSRDLAIMPRSPTSRSSCKRRAILSPKSLEGPFLGNCKLYSAGRNYDDPAPAADERGVWPQNASQIRPSARASGKRAFASEAAVTVAAFVALRNVMWVDGVHPCCAVPALVRLRSRYLLPPSARRCWLLRHSCRFISPAPLFFGSGAQPPSGLF